MLYLEDFCCHLLLLISNLGGTFRFTAKLSGKYMEFPNTPVPTGCVDSPTVTIPTEGYVYYNG